MVSSISIAFLFLPWISFSAEEMRNETGFHFTVISIYILVAYWFTTWAAVVAMALLYDLAAVLLPIRPLRLLLELAISRDEKILASV